MRRKRKGFFLKITGQELDWKQKEEGGKSVYVCKRHGLRWDKPSYGEERQ